MGGLVCSYQGARVFCIQDPLGYLVARQLDLNLL